MKTNRKSFLAGSAAAAVFGFPNVVLGKGEPIRLGVIPPITGSNALNGEMELEGSHFAVDEINARPGKVYDDRPFQLVIEDATNDNQAAVAALNKLLGENIVALVVPVLSTQVQAMAPVMKNQTIPWMTGGTNVKNTQLGLRNLFRCRASDAITAAALVSFAVNGKKAKKVAILHASETFGVGGADQCEVALKKYGLTAITRQSYPKDAKDFTSEILKIKQSGADALIMYIQNPSDVALILAQVRSLGLNIPIIGSPSVGNQSVIETAGKNADGVYAGLDFIVGNNSAKATRFINAFQKRYHHLPDVGTGQGWVYDSVSLLADTYKKIGTTDPVKAVDALHQVKRWEGVLGDFTCDAEGNFIHSISIGLIQNSKITQVQKVTA